jgi:hypothetical protein
MKVKLNKKNAEVLFIAGVNTLLETALLPGAHIYQVKIPLRVIASCVDKHSSLK